MSSRILEILGGKSKSKTLHDIFGGPFKLGGFNALIHVDLVHEHFVGPRNVEELDEGHENALTMGDELLVSDLNAELVA